jgi:N-acetylglucosaminyldiphosphoundecaprenol N-acetyl-beta-D-mannosaminyltransferase
MGLNIEKVLGIPVNTSSKEEILEYVKKYLRKKPKSEIRNPKIGVKPLVIFTPNPEIIAFSQRHPDFKEIVTTAQINLPDGSGVVWAMKRINGISVRRISGVDFMANLCEMAAKNRVRVGLIGGRGEVALRTAECLITQYPRLEVEVLETPIIRIKNKELRMKKQKIVKNQSGGNKHLDSYFIILESKGNAVRKEQYFQNLVKQLEQKHIGILFFALGVPKQEWFIDRVQRSAVSGQLKTPLVLMAVGGAFDYISGSVPRAPELVRNAGLEWFYRLIREPWRLKRQLLGARFFLDVLLKK